MEAAPLGILLGCDAEQEWMLPWWWFHYTAHNSHPVAFIDFGCSEAGKAWCRAHGQLIPLAMPALRIAGRSEVDSALCAQWEAAYTPHFWALRNAWFKKPFALLQSPYLRTLWIDLDCEIKAPLDPLFALPTDLAISRESLIAQEFYREHGLLLPEEISYNSGVIFYRRHASPIARWAQRALFEHRQFLGDQNLLSRILFEEKAPLYELPDLWNWNRRLGENPKARIYHWTGGWGKAQIREKIEKIASIR